MFPLLRNRAARALDVAIEFATLGEYRLADPVAPGAPARGARRRAEPMERREGALGRPAARGVAFGARFAPGVRGAPAARLVVPASAAAAARLRPVPVADDVAIKRLAREHDGVVATPAMRVRGGMAPPPAQPCESRAASPRR
jgi:hypothetical protein